MLGKQISRLLFAAALQQAAHGHPLDVVGNSAPPKDLSSWCPSHIGGVPMVLCQGRVLWCLYGIVGIAAGGCAKDETGEWALSRKWTEDEIIDYVTYVMPSPEEQEA